MKKIFSFVVCLLLLCNYQLLFAQIYQGRNADLHIRNADMVRFEDYTHIPTFVRFSEKSNWQKSDFAYFSRTVLKLSKDHDFSLINEQTDKLGMLHERFKQTYQNIPVEGSMLLLHSKNGKLISFNGDVFDNIFVNTTPQLTAEQALEKAHAYIKAEKYFSSSKEGLVIVPLNGNYKQTEWHLAYKFNIYAEKPLSRREIFIDAQNGEVVFELNELHSGNSNGTAVTKYSGTQPIVTDSTANGFTLHRTSGGNGGDIHTYNMQTDTNYGNAVDFVDLDNYWNNVNPQRDEAATDAHWGASQTYDYYLSQHNRNSIDAAGMDVISYVHYDVAYYNAFWNGQFATFGDGSGKPLTGIDIVAHEFTHGVTGFSAGLQYLNESGALNESFSDIFGAAIEFYSKPNSANWLIGENSPPVPNPAIRSMSNPKLMGNPDTYLGQAWYIGPADNGGVHNNSGVQNYWFYLVCQGDTGTNDLGNFYEVNGVGITDGAAIAYRNLTVYLTPISDYSDAHFYSLISTYDLFGACTPQAEAVTNAWYAVGIGNPYTPNVVADFEADKYIFCEKPATVQFMNNCINASVYNWNFGDGTTSTANFPVHVYNNYGDYTVTLVASGGACGTDTLIKTAYISVQPNNPCIINLGSVVSNAVWSHCVGTLYDSGGPTNGYQLNEDHTVTIEPTGAYSVQLTFTNFQVSPGDKLYIHDGPSTSSPVINVYSGTNIPTVLNSSYGAITLHFLSDNTINNAGFEMEWKCSIPNAAPVADFAANNTVSCDGMINFTDLSTQGGGNWVWDFGDGTISNAQNPTHEYLANGTYNVSLLVSNQYGNDAETKNTYITVNRPAQPISQDVFLCGAGSVTLNATGAGDLTWKDANNQIVGIGSTFNTPFMNTPKDYWVSAYVWAASLYGGAAANTIGNGSYLNNEGRYPIFDVFQPCYLRSIRVYAQTAGTRTFEYYDKFGALLNSKTAYVPQGDSRVTLDFPLQVGTDAYLKMSASSNVDLYRNNTGASYPYNIGSFLSITKNSSNAANAYFYFYDWEVAATPCISPAKKVTAYVGGTQPTADFYYNQAISTVSFFNTSLNDNAAIWEFGDGTTSTTLQPAHTYSALGTYNVLLRALNGGCVDSTVQTVTITALSGIEDADFAQNIQLFPNPGSESFTLAFSLEKAEQVQIEMHNVLGQTVLISSPQMTNEFEQTFSLANFANGIYNIQIKVGEKVTYKKFFVSK